MIEGVLAFALAMSVGLNVWQLTRWSELRELIQTGVDKAERTKNGWVKLPLNDVLRLGFSCRHGGFAWPDRLWRDPKELRRKGGPHPAVLSPANRRNL